MTKEELINLGKRHIIDELRTQLGKKKYRFLIPELKKKHCCLVNRNISINSFIIH